MHKKLSIFISLFCILISISFDSQTMGYAPRPYKIYPTLNVFTEIIGDNNQTQINFFPEHELLCELSKSVIQEYIQNKKFTKNDSLKATVEDDFSLIEDHKNQTAVAIFKISNNEKLPQLTFKQVEKSLNQLFEIKDVAIQQGHHIVTFAYNDKKDLPHNTEQAHLLRWWALLNPSMSHDDYDTQIYPQEIEQISHQENIQVPSFQQGNKTLNSEYTDIISWSEKSLNFIKATELSQLLTNFKPTNAQDWAVYSGIVSNINHYCETISSLPTSHEQVLTTVTALNLFHVLEKSIQSNENDLANTLLGLTNTLDQNPVTLEEVNQFLTASDIQMPSKHINHILSKINIVSHAITDLTIGAFTRSVKEQAIKLYLWNDTIAQLLPPNDPFYEPCSAKEICHNMLQEPIQKINIIIGYAFVGGNFDKNMFDFKADSIQHCTAQYRQHDSGQEIIRQQYSIQRNPQVHATDFSHNSHTSCTAKLNDQSLQVIIQLVGSKSFNLHISPELGIQSLEDLQQRNSSLDLPQYRYTITQQTSKTTVKTLTPQIIEYQHTNNGGSSSNPSSNQKGTGINIPLDLAPFSVGKPQAFANANCLLAVPGIVNGILHYWNANTLNINNLLTSKTEICKIIPSDIEVKARYQKQTPQFLINIINEVDQSIQTGKPLNLSKFKNPYNLDPMHDESVEVRMQFKPTFNDQKFNDFVNNIANAAINLLEHDVNDNHTCQNPTICKINKAGTIIGKLSYYLDAVSQQQILNECKTSHPHMYDALRMATWSGPRKGFERLKDNVTNFLPKKLNKNSSKQSNQLISQPQNSDIQSTITELKINQSHDDNKHQIDQPIHNTIASSELQPKTLEIIVKDLGYDPSILKPIDNSFEGIKIHEALLSLMNKANETARTSQNEWYRLLGIQTLDATAEQYKVWAALKGNAHTTLGNTKEFVQRAFERYSQLSDPREFFSAAYNNTWIIAHQLVDLTINQALRSPEDRTLYWQEFCSKSVKYLEQLANSTHQDFFNYAADLVGTTAAAIDNLNLTKAAISGSKLLTKGLRVIAKETTRHGIKKGIKNSVQYLKDSAKQTITKARNTVGRRLSTQTVDQRHARRVKTPAKSQSTSKQDSQTEPPASRPQKSVGKTTNKPTTQQAQPVENAHPMQTRSKANSKKNVNQTSKSIDINNDVLNNQRTGSALKEDACHAFNDIIDNYAGTAQQFKLNNQQDGIERSLYQLEGTLNNVDGIFEWIIDPDPNIGVNHRVFIPGGKITGKPNQWRKKS